MVSIEYKRYRIASLRIIATIDPETIRFGVSKNQIQTLLEIFGVNLNMVFILVVNRNPNGYDSC
jgi:hypothetical protein